jgi:hypothetical protein
MKKLLFSIALTAVAAFSAKTAVAQEVTAGPKIEFKKDTHDYGNIKYGADGSCSFEFKNTGNAPLIISNAKGSCGCTVPEWPKEPINPGKTGSIKVKYDTKRPGVINKSVTITSNAVDEPTKILRIKGEVGPRPESATPVNTSGAPVN